jgi:hypothetical protein
MKIDSQEAISRWLEDSGGLYEALLTELRLTKHGYSVHIKFSVIIDREGRVLDSPLNVEFDFEGVQRLTLEGDLSEYMLDHPEEINWGLSEVTLVRVLPTEDGIRFEAGRESGRRIEIQCRRATLEVLSEPASK